jgi:hypothetical protein
MKGRNVFALKNFRGLDKENKLLKVQPFRATDGFNFIIESETLKTRPSISINKNPNFFLEQGDYLVDWHVFGDTTIYITKKHFYFEFKNEAIINENDTSLIGSTKRLVKGILPASFDFSNNQPIFQEEKDALFVFGLDGIYVFSYIKNDQDNLIGFVFYELSNKPINPYTIDTHEFNFLANLPTPYEPTLFLGNNRLDDVNLLSNISKYRLFANTRQSVNNNISFDLPTHYQESKHGSFIASQNVSVSFYKDRYEGFEALPIFMGVQNEDFFNLEAYGEELDVDDNVETILEIENIYRAKRDFEFFGTTEDLNTIKPIFRDLNLPKDEFFNMVVKGTNGQTVFEFLMNQIKLRQDSGDIEDWEDNKYVVFSLKVQNNWIFRDELKDAMIVQNVRKESTYNVYVQLRKYETSEVNFSNPSVFLSQETIATNFSDPYNDYPTRQEEADVVLPVLNGGNGIVVQNALEPVVFDEIERLAETYIINNSNEYENGDVVEVQGRVYQTIFINSDREEVIFSQNNTDKYFNVYYQEFSDDPNNFPAYPTFNNPDNIPVVTIRDENRFIGFGDFSIFNNTDYYALKNYILNNINLFPSTSGLAFVKVRFISRVINPETFATSRLFYSYVVKVSYFNNPLVEAQRRLSFSYVATVQETTVPIVDNLYSVSLSEDKTVIKLSVKDYFFDYKNEPSIDVRVSFNLNTDYQLIAKSTFGITFGSENRLFLAGNKDYPNIDRYNISNDLLGGNVKNQSYELSYFPSKNYRVLGGKGAINGYVIATDSQLYITKKHYPNDSKLFIRQRNIGQGGNVEYFEFKTNITKSPLNNRCLVRFYNDILVLDKDGLYGIEISQNVLTDERLVKLRSGFINKELVSKISQYDNSKIFIIENNVYMYIFIGTKVYVADSRYIAQNPNSSAENVSYEIMDWNLPNTFFNAKVLDEVIYLNGENNNLIYGFGNFNSDDIAKKEDLALIDGILLFSTAVVQRFSGSTFNYVFSNPQNYTVQLESAYKVFALLTTDYTLTNEANTRLWIQPTVNGGVFFVDIKDGDKIYFFENGFLTEKIVKGFEENNRTKFYVDYFANNQGTFLYLNVSKKDLFFKTIMTVNEQTYFVFSHLKPESVLITNNINDFTSRDAIISRWPLSQIRPSVVVFEKKPIEMRWVSSITDFGNSQMEKTSFRVNLFATKKEETNNITFGYRTMRRLAGLTEVIDLSSDFNFDEVAFTQFALATFDTVALSRPMKENNFLYIQFILNGVGKIEMNGIEVLYKLNRMLKSIG